MDFHKKFPEYVGKNGISLSLIHILDFFGHISMTCYHKKIFNGTVVSRVIHKVELESALRVTRRVSIGELPADGIIGIVLTSKLDGTEIYGGYYGTSDILKVDDIHVGIGICTFKREMCIRDRC